MILAIQVCIIPAISKSGMHHTYVRYAAATYVNTCYIREGTYLQYTSHNTYQPCMTLAVAEALNPQ